MREIDAIHCSCGGKAHEVDPTADEEAAYGCARPGCCVAAYVCDKCGTRLTFELAAPECRDYD